MSIESNIDNDTPPSDQKPIKDAAAIADAFQEINGTMPEVSDHVVNMQQEETQPLASVNAGEPVTAEKKKRGRPPKNPNAPPSQKTSRVGAQPKPHDPMIQMQADNQARLAVAVNAATQLVQVSGIIVAGVENAVMTKEEQLIVASGFEGYFNAKGVTDFPPGIALGFALFPYYARVLVSPPAKSKMNLGFAWLKNKISGIFSKKYSNAPYVNSGNDNERKNNTSEKTR